eukprot:357049-Chlamydomonas_euryale.AAC.1
MGKATLSNCTHQPLHSNPADIVHVKTLSLPVQAGETWKDKEKENSPPTSKGQQAGKRKDGEKGGPHRSRAERRNRAYPNPLRMLQDRQ